MQYANLEGERVRAPQLLPQCLAAAEDFLADYTERQWLPQPATLADPPVTKVYRGAPRKWRWTIADLRVATAVVYNGLPMQAVVPLGLGSWTGTVAGYELDGPTTHPDGTEEPAKVLRVYGGLYAPVGVGGTVLEVTGHWGWLPIPARINDAVYRLAARIYHERAATYSDAVLLPEGGVMQYFRQLPATVQAAVEKLRMVHVGLAGVG